MASEWAAAVSAASFKNFPAAQAVQVAVPVVVAIFPAAQFVHAAAPAAEKVPITQVVQVVAA